MPIEIGIFSPKEEKNYLKQVEWLEKNGWKPVANVSKVRFVPHIFNTNIDPSIGQLYEKPFGIHAFKPRPELGIAKKYFLGRYIFLFKKTTWVGTNRYLKGSVVMVHNYK